jgi:integral membrane protein (TIGR01906 family)
MRKISAIAISLAVLILALKFTLNFKPLYYYDIHHLNITQSTSLNENEIKSTYDYLIYFVNSNQKIDFNIPLLPSSREGAIHFQEVKNIFIKLDYILYFSLIVSAVGIYRAIKEREYSLFKWASNFILIFSLCMIVPFSINFDASFILFHKIFFFNTYWLFDPALDPVINILPEEFFFHEAILIILLALLSAVILRLLYHKLKK